MVSATTLIRIFLSLHLLLAIFDYRFLLIPWFYIVLNLLDIGRIFGSPWVPSSKEAIKRMLELAEVKPNMLVYDLGSGDGRVVIMAAREFKARAVGIEINPILAIWSKLLVKIFGLSKRVKIIRGNFFKEKIKDADVVITYLLKETNEKLRKKLKKELKSGSKVVALKYPFYGWKTIKFDKKFKIYVYKIKKF